MKIAYILYGSFSSLDLASIYNPIAFLKKNFPKINIVWDLCAFNEHIFNDQGWPVSSTRVNCNLSDYDIVVVPGSEDVTKLIKNDTFLSWLNNISDDQIIAAVGKGSLLLADTGLLKKKTVAVINEDQKFYKEFDVVAKNENIIVDNKIFTAAGSSAAIDLGLILCEKIASKEQLAEVKKYLGFQKADLQDFNNLTDFKTPDIKGTRSAIITRKSKETDIKIGLNIDGSGNHNIKTGLPFFDHMLCQIPVHGLFDLDINAEGDLEIDPHHTIEDVGLALGQAFQEALGNRAGIYRMASFNCPMDDSLANVVIDFSGRAYAHIQMDALPPIIGGIPPSLFTHFFESFAIQAKCNLHIKVPYGRDGHHQVEAVFKALARALKAATQIDPRRGSSIPSSKGILY